MNKSNIFVLVLAFLFTLSMFPSAYSLTYRSDVNNGSWSQYDNGLTSDYYASDTGQATYNRDLESPVSIVTGGSWCNGSWCLFENPFSGSQAFTTSSTSYEGSQSLLFYVSYQNFARTIYQQTENVADSNVIFHLSVMSSIYNFVPSGNYYGVVNDSNILTSYGQFIVPMNDESWKTYSFHAPAGSWRFGIENGFIGGGTDGSLTIFIDSIQVIRNNAGTFYKGKNAPNCSNISSCSNVTSLTSNNERHLYWIADYVPSATCTYSINGVSKGTMTEMTGGMYYGLIDSVPTSSPIDVNILASCTKIPYNTKSFKIDPTISPDSNIVTTMQTGNNGIGNTGIRGSPITFYSKYLDDVGSTITGGTCTLKIAGVPYNMPYNASTGRNEYSFGFISDGLYVIDHNCSKPTYQGKTSTYNFNVSESASGSLIFTPITNISSYSSSVFSPTVAFVISNNISDIIFSALNNATTSSFNFSWSNLIKSGSQYFVYTSTDGNAWTFSDTATFGATNSSPVQKIWNPTTSQYDYNFSITLSPTVTYVKLVFQPVAKYWETIGGSSDWFNQNPATSYSDSSGKKYDLFSDSNYSNLQSYTIPNFQNLVSGDMTVGYELQFTAYGTSAGTLAVGTRPLTGSDVTSNISVTTTPTRFSVPIAPASRDAKLIIKSASATSNSYYITDYAIVPRSYFVGQLEIKNPDYTNLQSILHNDGLGNMVSYKYILEGQPARIQSSAYDISGDLSKIEIQVLIGATLIKDQFITLNSYAGNTINFNQIVDGFVDLNGIGGELNSSNPLRIITYKAIIWNKSNQAVSEQSNTVAILQFPYFPNDFRMTADLLSDGTKLGTNPKIRVSIKDSVPSNFLGLEFRFYNPYYSLASPNYSEIIYTKDLGCTDLQNCTIDLTFDKYVWESAGNFTVQVTALITTENKNYTDSYTNVTKHAIITPSGYLLAQMIQYNERHQNSTPHTPYLSTEKIPIMLGVIDDTGKNLSDTLTPYFTLTVGANNYTTKFYPDAFTYDETSGTNIWLWNQYLYDDTGNLLPDMNTVKFRGVIVDKRQTQSSDNNFGFANRCTLYPVDLVGNGATYIVDAWNSWWGAVGTDIFNWKINNNSGGWVATGVKLIGSGFGSIGLNGCIGYPDNLVYQNSASDSNITIDNQFPLSEHADNRQALYCGQKIDDSNSVIDRIGDEFGCVLLIHEDLQQIDGVHIQIGNDNSDYSVTTSNKQYLDVTITGNDIIFSDPQKILRNWYQKGYFGASPTGSPTIQEIVGNAWHEFFAPNLTVAQVQQMYNFTELMGGTSTNAEDKNIVYGFKDDFNAQTYNKAIFFKVKGLSTINAYDYLTSEQQLSFNTKNFLSYAKENNLPIYQKKMQVIIYNNSTDSPMKVIEFPSPFVINKAPTVKQQVRDTNGKTILTDISERLPFHVISTMTTANATISNRLIANLSFLQIIKANPMNQGGDTGFSAIAKFIDDFFNGKDSQGNPTGLLNAPLVFMMVNWFYIFLLVGTLIIFSLVFMAISPILIKR